MSVLTAHKLEKRYGPKTVVSDVSIAVADAEIVGLLGPNGAGKTTTFRMIMGIIKPDKGEILFNGQNITHLPLSKRARRGIGYLSQEPSVFRRLTVEQNIMVVLENMKLSKDERMNRCLTLLEEAEIAHLQGQLADTLSGGEKRRLEICRALAAEPKILLLDEPFSGVDPIAVSDLQDIIVQLKDRGIGILITDHSVRETLEVTDRSYILSDGVILTQGSADELIDDPAVREVYLGEKFYFRSQEKRRDEDSIET